MRNTLTKSYKPLSRAYSCLQDDPARNSLESSEELFSVFNSEKIRELNSEFYETWQKKKHPHESYILQAVSVSAYWMSCFTI